MNNEIRKKILELKEMVLNDELHNFIQTLKDLTSYVNLKELTSQDKNYLYNELLLVIKEYKKQNSSFELKLHEANIYYELNDYANAENLYKEVLSEKDDIVEAYQNLGNIYIAKESFSEAIDVLNIANTLKPDNFLIYRKLGKTYALKKNLKNAVLHYEKSIELLPDFGWSYLDLAEIYIKLEEYDKAIFYCTKALDLENSEDFYRWVKETLNEINKRKFNSDYKKVSLLIDEIKELLHTDTYIITHYTSLSTTRALLLKKSKLRLSEATFLNDTSEGKTLLNYLGVEESKNTNYGLSYEFIKKPYIGSFVNHELDNDLTLWRMYGKEGKEEAEGCSLKIDGAKFISEFRDSLKKDSEQWNDDIAKEFKFYRVAYLGENFCKSGNSKNDKLLKKKLAELKDFIKRIELTTNILQRISEITYMFKTKEYQHENETRLVLSSTILNEVLDESFVPTKVYVELAPLNSSLIKLTIGPKVKLADEWAASFYYSLKKENLFPIIEISTLPFK